MPLNEITVTDIGNTFLKIQQDGEITFCVGDKTILLIDNDGLEYKGKRIEDAGQAHKAFIETLNSMKEIMWNGTNITTQLQSKNPYYQEKKGT